MKKLKKHFLNKIFRNTLILTSVAIIVFLILKKKASKIPREQLPQRKKLPFVSVANEYELLIWMNRGIRKKRLGDAPQKSVIMRRVAEADRRNNR